MNDVIQAFEERGQEVTPLADIGLGSISQVSL